MYRIRDLFRLIRPRRSVGATGPLYRRARTASALLYFDTKGILKRAMRSILPEPILRKKKVGFNPPAPRWINSELKPLIAQLLAPQVIERRGMFRPDAVSRLIREHAESKRDNTLKIWALLMIELWQRPYFDREPESSVRQSVRATARNRPVLPTIRTSALSG